MKERKRDIIRKTIVGWGTRIGSAHCFYWLPGRVLSDVYPRCVYFYTLPTVTAASQPSSDLSACCQRCFSSSVNERLCSWKLHIAKKAFALSVIWPTSISTQQVQYITLHYQVFCRKFTARNDVTDSHWNNRKSAPALFHYRSLVSVYVIAQL